MRVNYSITNIDGHLGFEVATIGADDTVLYQKVTKCRMMHSKFVTVIAGYMSVTTRFKITNGVSGFNYNLCMFEAVELI